MHRLLNAPRPLQTAAAILLAMLAGAALLWFVSTIIGHFIQQRDELDASRENVGRLMRFAEMDLSQVSHPALSGPGTDELFVHAPSIAIARADLQQRIGTIVGSQNTYLASVGNAPDLNENNATLIGMRVDFSGSYVDVTNALYLLETSTPPLILRDMSLNASGVDLTDRPPELAAQLHVYAAVRIEAPEASGAGAQ